MFVINEKVFKLDRYPLQIDINVQRVLWNTLFVPFWIIKHFIRICFTTVHKYISVYIGFQTKQVGILIYNTFNA